jgi:hypothetical protein
MDEKELQLKEKELEIASSNNSFNQKFNEGLNKQENLRRAIEVGSNCYVKFNPLNDKNSGDDKVREALRSLVLSAAIKLKDEIVI